jgi:hypothetical protein
LHYARIWLGGTFIGFMCQVSYRAYRKGAGTWFDSEDEGYIICGGAMVLAWPLTLAVLIGSLPFQAIYVIARRLGMRAKERRRIEAERARILNADPEEMALILEKNEKQRTQ